MQWTWWTLAIVIPAWFLELLLHEASHLLVGWIHEKRRPTGIYPYPHRYRNKFYFARYSSGRSRFPLIYYYKNNHLPRHIAPVWFGLLTFLIVGTIIILAPPTVRPWLVPSAAFGLGESLIFLWGYFLGSKKTDGKRWRYGERGKR